MKNLDAWGWSPFFESQLEPGERAGCLIARVCADYRTVYALAGPQGEREAELSGKLKGRMGDDPAARPVVGDWVVAQDAPGRASIRRTLERRGAFVRRAPAARGGAQVVVANADFALLMASLNRDLNPRRIERYLALAWESGAEPVVVLNKADLCADLPAALAEVEALAAGSAVIAVSALTGAGLDELRARLAPGRAAVLLGSSGVGKSTLVNRLLGEARAEVREIGHDDKGRHTTTARQMHALPSGALLIDTPGMRELGLWDAETGLAQAFADLEDLARDCRFRDCTHASEPGCAVLEAVASGALPPERLASFRKLGREQAFQARQEHPELARNAKRRWKQIHKAMRRRERMGEG
ncbi:MAG: ribosome small subunit-dependent GTPase A [Planctomycetota bacterium]|nr:ribosome small subunit-dependent GTPase A [Planctomycetota bacterium]